MTKRTFTVALGDPAELAAVVAARLGIDARQAEGLVARGAVHVAGKRARAGAVAVGARIVVYWPSEAAASSPDGLETATNALRAVELVYRDDWVVVANKPAGMPSQATRADAAGALDAQVRDRVGQDARLLHRLDRDASGLVLFAARSEACAPLQAALGAGEIARTYVAIAGGLLDGAGRITHRIARDSGDPRRRVALPEAAPGGQPAATCYRALAHSEGETALELTLETGRTHQLRVHLAAEGHPLRGDRLYGGATDARLFLHAARLELPHPRDRRRLVVRSPLPPAFLARLPALTDWAG